MESLFLVNPRGKKRRKGKMPAGLKRYWASRRSGGTRKRRRKARAVMANPRRRHRRKNPVVRSYRRRRARSRRRNPFKRHRHRARHRNPFNVSGIKDMVAPAAIGALGAIATSVAYGFAAPQLPASLQTGYLPALVKGAVAIGLGMLAGKFLGRDKGRAVTLGGLTVVIVGAVTPLIASAVPTLPGLNGLRGMSDYVPYSRPGVGAYMRNPGKLGAYLTKPMPGMKGLGFMSPAAVIQPSRSPNVNMGDWNGWQNDGM